MTVIEGGTVYTAADARRWLRRPRVWVAAAAVVVVLAVVIGLVLALRPDRIAKLVDATVIAPGATFSLNRKVGERTTAKGFVAAPAIVDGELGDQLGGGISQFSTTLFNAAWFAGLRILRHQPHSKYISRYPPGREATLDWGSIDQVIRNDTTAPVVIRTRTTATSVTVALYGHTGDRKVLSTTGARIPSGPDGGFGITVRRAVYQGGTKAAEASLHWTYDGLD